MNFKAIAMVALAAVTLTACSDDDSGTTATVGGPKIRVVNSAYKDIGGVPTAIAIDYMLDSAATGASSTDVTVTAFDDIPANSISNVTSAGVATDAGYVEFEAGVHSYVAREADSVGGSAGGASQFYKNTNNESFLPRQFLTSGTYYTFIVSGSIPSSGITRTTFPFTALVDDPFPPPTLASGVYQARFRIINAAPYGRSNGAGSTVTIWVTPGTAIPDLSTTQSLATASYRNASAYMNMTAGTYTITIRANTGSIILYQEAVTLAAGEVRSLILQSNSATISGYTPSAANHKVTNILDQQY